MTRTTNTAPLTVVKSRTKDEIWDKPMRTEGLPLGENQRIGEMLSYRRPHNSAGEWMFIERYIEPLNPEWIIEPLREEGEKSLGETHAFVVRSIVYLLDPSRVNDPLKILNASVTEVAFDGEAFSLGAVGSTAWHRP